ncbi:MAG: CatB-related O-acetyltransferase [Candidatus Rickettsia vulgarisii]
MSVKDNTIVGNDVWIGYNTTFMPRVKIGDGAIIATNSTVTKDVDPYNIVGGSPAKLIRKRFDDRTIEKLLELRWWDMEIGKLNEHIKDKGLILKKVGWYKLKFLNYLFKLYDKNIL